MSAAERRLWRQIKTEAARLTPEMQRSIERSFELLRDSLSVGEMAKLAEGVRADAFVSALLEDAALDRAFNPARARLIASVQASAAGLIRTFPEGGAIAAGFNVLDPRVAEAIRVLDTRVMQSLRQEVRETVRTAFATGIEAGLPPLTIARRVRDSIGLAPNQLEAVDNFRAALEDGDISKALRYSLRDRRFDGTIRGIAKKGPLTTTQVNTMVSAYHRRRLAQNALTHSYTAVNDAQRLGKHLATIAGIDAGVLPADRMMSRWSSSRDGKVRPLHVEMDGVEVPFGTPFPTGDVIPGASEWGCRCIKVDFISKGPRPAAPPPVAQPEPPAASMAGVPSPAEYPVLRADASDTMARFRAADGTWTPERQALHDRIVAEHFEGLTPAAGRAEIMVTGGGPASGKGSILKNIEAPNHVLIDPDHIKTKIPEYQEGVRLGRLDAAAFAHEESSYLRDRVAEEVVRRRFNAVIDGTGDNGYEKLAGKIGSYRAGGARIVANYVTVDTEVAMERMLSRGRRTGRYVPEAYVRGVHANIREILPRAIEEGLFDDLTIWDNNGATAIPMARVRDGVLEILDEDAWARFLAAKP